MKYRVFFGCSQLGPPRCSDPFDTEEAARQYMHEEATKMAAQMGIDPQSRYLQLEQSSYHIITGRGATYSGCLLPAEEE